MNQANSWSLKQVLDYQIITVIFFGGGGDLKHNNLNNLGLGAFRIYFWRAKYQLFVETKRGSPSGNGPLLC